MKSTYRLFEAYGIELEYMIVDRSTLKVSPKSDRIFMEKNGQCIGELEDGIISWSNELVLHVVELKTTNPASTLDSLEDHFHASLKKIENVLGELQCRLLPTAMHPTMIPKLETHLWPHDSKDVYDTYDRIFGCQGHGWSNLQSMHINLPFSNDEEFRKLHSAIRFILPLLPALAASSPIFEGNVNGVLCNRLLFYQNNQKRIPLIAGSVVPELVHSISDYKKDILESIYQQVRPLDPDEMICEEWVNSRGAIARFDRNAIEIRVLDIQECPKADVSLAALIVAALKILVSGDILSLQVQEMVSTSQLKEQFDLSVVHAENAPLCVDEYRFLFEMDNRIGDSYGGLTARDVWKRLHQLGLDRQLISVSHAEVVDHFLKYGSLSSRILRQLNIELPVRENIGVDVGSINKVYNRLAECLRENKLFI